MVYCVSQCGRGQQSRREVPKTQTVPSRQIQNHSFGPKAYLLLLDDQTPRSFPLPSPGVQLLQLSGAKSELTILVSHPVRKYSTIFIWSVKSQLSVPNFIHNTSDVIKTLYELRFCTIFIIVVLVLVTDQ